MKNWKSVLATVLALGLCGTLTGCGSSESGSTAEVDANSSVADDEEKSDSSADSDADSADEETTEVPTENNSALYQCICKDLMQVCSPKVSFRS